VSVCVLNVQLTVSAASGKEDAGVREGNQKVSLSALLVVNFAFFLSFLC